MDNTSTSSILERMTLQQKRSLRNQLFAEALRSEVERRAAILIAERARSAATTDLAAATDDQLVAQNDKPAL